MLKLLLLIIRMLLIHSTASHIDKTRKRMSVRLLKIQSIFKRLRTGWCRFQPPCDCKKAMNYN